MKHGNSRMYLMCMHFHIAARMGLLDSIDNPALSQVALPASSDVGEGDKGDLHIHRVLHVGLPLEETHELHDHQPGHSQAGAAMPWR